MPAIVQMVGHVHLANAKIVSVRNSHINN